MSRLQQFTDNIAANIVSALLIAGLCGAGGFVLALFTAAAYGLSRWEQAGIVGACVFVIVGVSIMVFVYFQARKAQKPMGSEQLNSAARGNTCSIQKAEWGNEHSRESVKELLETMQPNALTFHVDPHTLKSEPAPGLDKYIDITYKFPGRPASSIRRKQGDWVVLPEDPILVAENKRLEMLAQHRAFRLATAIGSLQTAGACEQLAWQVEQLRDRLQEVLQTLELDHDTAALDKLVYPLYRGYPGEEEPEKWKWWHRFLIKFQDAYETHRKMVIRLSLLDFQTFVTTYDVGSNHPDTHRLRLIDGLTAHAKTLRAKAEEIVKAYAD